MKSEHIVILGGSTGIGLSTAQHFSKLGSKVTITGRDPAKLEAAKKTADVQAIVADASEAEAMRKAFQAIGAFDHLVLSFGSRKGLGPFASADIKDVEQGFQEKVFSQYACAQAALPYLRKDGSIVFVAAVSAHGAAPNTSGIGAQNAAVAALVPILAAELKPRRVNGVSPGIIDTPWWDWLPADQKRAAFADFASKIPVGRVGKPEDIASAIGFLVTNSFMTGHGIVADGGISLG
jgi:NAD(P)-dependent dehydrogenase (short-subunit alcohol dehydrogenase family)